jgi:hypothetical protein
MISPLPSALMVVETPPENHERQWLVATVFHHVGGISTDGKMITELPAKRKL